MLILLLDGMWAGIQRQATVYTDRAGADLYVLQPGIRDLTAGASTLPLATVAKVAVNHRTDPDHVAVTGQPFPAGSLAIDLDDGHGSRVVPASTWGRDSRPSVAGPMGPHALGQRGPR